MLSNAEIHQAIQNLNLLIANPDSSAPWFTLNDNKLTKNWLFQTDEEGVRQLESYLQNLINELSNEAVDFNDHLYLSLFISLQYFLHLEPNQVLAGIHLDLRGNDYLQRKELNLQRLAHDNPANQFMSDIQAQRLPEINYDIRTGHYTAADDHKAHQHGEEALRIFLATQVERFKAFCNWLFAKIGIHVFETASYREHDYLDSEIYTHAKPIEPDKNYEQTPSHYWVGHATNLITIPTDHSPLHVLTDPVEGDLAPFIYPRMTDEASLIDGTDSKRLPKIDVVLISHNHRDHVSEETLKRLLKQQPKMIVPEGDEALFINLGFRNVVGLKWWEQATIEDVEGQELLKVTAVPARHWSGRSLHDAHRSAFNGYVLSSAKTKGDIYFAGDTALMNDEVLRPIFEEFNIVSSIQPGGPDERREDMESTHQSSADGILMHFKILAAEYKKMKADNEALSLAEFLEKIKPLKTIYNHTATFKLGNLRLKDTFFSYQRMVAAFQESEQWRTDHLPQHEQNAYHGIQYLMQEMVFRDDERFDNKLIVEQILRAVVIPKIGQKQPLYFSEGVTQTKAEFQHRYLITNRRALIEFDDLLQNFVANEQESVDLKTILLNLLDRYQSPWHASFTRNHLHLEPYKEAIRACQDNQELLAVLNSIEISIGPRNRHGHMQSLIHYGKWLIEFTNQHPDDSQAQFKAYFICQEIKKQVEQETHYTGWILGATNRAPKQQAFLKLADQLADLPAEKGRYETTITEWLTTRVDEQLSVKQMLGDNRSHFFTTEQTRSEETVNRLQALVR